MAAVASFAAPLNFTVFADGIQLNYPLILLPFAWYPRVPRWCIGLLSGQFLGILLCLAVLACIRPLFDPAAQVIGGIAFGAACSIAQFYVMRWSRARGVLKYRPLRLLRAEPTMLRSFFAIAPGERVELSYDHPDNSDVQVLQTAMTHTAQPQTRWQSVVGVLTRRFPLPGAPVIEQIDLHEPWMPSHAIGVPSLGGELLLSKGSVLIVRMHNPFLAAFDVSLVVKIQERSSDPLVRDMDRLSLFLPTLHVDTLEPNRVVTTRVVTCNGCGNEAQHESAPTYQRIKCSHCGLVTGGLVTDDAEKTA